MSKEVKSHKLDYIVLYLILIVGFGVFYYFSYNRIAQIFVGGVVCFSYLGWGIVHHFEEHNLNWKIVIEYSLFAIVSFILITSVLVRA